MKFKCFHLTNIIFKEINCLLPLMCHHLPHFPDASLSSLPHLPATLSIDHTQMTQSYTITFILNKGLSILEYEGKKILLQ